MRSIETATTQKTANIENWNKVEKSAFLEKKNSDFTDFSILWIIKH